MASNLEIPFLEISFFFIEFSTPWSNMKSFLPYGHGQVGKTVPWLDGYRINPDGSSDIQISGVKIYEIADSEKDICWMDLFEVEKVNLLSEKELLFYESIPCDDCTDPRIFVACNIERLWDKLSSYCHPKSLAEKNFFEMYCTLSWNSSTEVESPALFPQVVVNWTWDKLERQKRTEPYIVDFVFKHNNFGTHNLTVVEIDGPSHYADYQNGKYLVSEEKYADHLRKDRWLRKNGFNVIRIGNHEIEEIMKLEKEERLRSFYHFFVRVFGHVICIEGFDEDGP
jgi:very-short-patch-repair endonuclease